METVAEYAALISNRKNLYRFLERIYKVEVDQILLEQLKEMSFPTDCGEELCKGYRVIEAYLRDAGADQLTDLAVDYARAFLGAGIVDSAVVAYPYESVYTSSKGLIMQEARDQVLAIYRAKGLSKEESLEFPEDHIALEFEFMAYLCQETEQALEAKDWPVVSALLIDQLDFLNQHLLNWVPQFCTDIEKFAETQFYKGVGKVTQGYLAMESTILEGFIMEVKA